MILFQKVKQKRLKQVNNYWEEINMSQELKKMHEKFVKHMGMPIWSRFNCPFCNEKLGYRALRSVSLCLNARNIGDIAVEFCCDKCKKMDTMYFREGIESIHEFIGLLSDNTETKSTPLIEGKMYELQYNNLAEKMISHKE